MELASSSERTDATLHNTTHEGPVMPPIQCTPRRAACAYTVKPVADHAHFCFIASCYKLRCTPEHKGGSRILVAQVTMNGRPAMKRLILAAAILAATPVVAFQAMAQGKPQSLMHYDVDVNTVSSGYRSSKIVGSAVTNDANDKIGSVDDLIVTRNDTVPYAIISVGGFLGMGDKLVAVPMRMLQIAPDKIVLPGGTKDALKQLPEFKYAK